MKSNKNSLKNTTFKTQETLKSFQGVFEIPQLLCGVNLILNSFYAFEHNKVSQKIVIAKLPYILEMRAQSIKDFAKEEMDLKALLTSKRLSSELLDNSGIGRNFLKSLLRLVEIFNDMKLSSMGSSQVSPLAKLLIDFADKYSIHRHNKYQIREISNNEDASSDLDLIRESLPHKQDIHKKINQKSTYEKTRDKRIRNCNKRRKTSYEKMKLLIKKAPNPLVIQIAFATQSPFDSRAINPEYKDSRRPTHFVNAFLALRNKKKFKNTIFKGLVGYIRKLELLDSQSSVGGYITLIFDHSVVEEEPYILGQKLVKQLSELSPDEDISEKGQFRYLFRANHLYTSTNKPYNQLTPVERYIEIYKVINFYTHSEYFFDMSKKRMKEDHKDSEIPTFNAFSFGLAIKK